MGEIMKANLKRKAKLGISVGMGAERTSLNVGRPEVGGLSWPPEGFRAGQWQEEKQSPGALASDRVCPPPH